MQQKQEYIFQYFSPRSNFNAKKSSPIVFFDFYDNYIL
jgi:hypothetical protein